MLVAYPAAAERIPPNGEWPEAKELRLQIGMLKILDGERARESGGAVALDGRKLFGVEGPPNFNAPFLAVNIQDMWRRWHMSLTLWLTDYLFTPLSMSLRDYGQAGLIGAICLNMIIIGVWHGFTLNYLVFGILHAVFLQPIFESLSSLLRVHRDAFFPRRAAAEHS